jgi:polysaccharide pyruvyl transferase WcaK-like protein
VRRDQPRIAFFGHFDGTNFGNECTLMATLHHLRRNAPRAGFRCICTGPESTAATYNIAAAPIRETVVMPWRIRNRLAQSARKLAIGIPIELYRWLKGFKTLWGTDALIIPGTGLLTDAYGLLGWGPYDLVRWSVTAKLCRCKLLFVSVGAGPVYSPIGRFLVKAALSLADFRSYRDEPTQRYLSSMGFRAENDKVCPDLVFSLPENLIPSCRDGRGGRPVVGLGLMEYPGRYSVERPKDTAYAAYLEALTEFVKWLLAHEYNVRLLIGDLADMGATREFRMLLKELSATHDDGRIIDEPIESVQDLLSQLAATDLVVATRFHNVLLSMILNKPVLAISFHHKCSSLMGQMGMSDYCQDINWLSSQRLIEKFCQLEKNAENLKGIIGEKVARCRRALDEQYRLIFKEISVG